jgi:hypothetical protein
VTRASGIPGPGAAAIRIATARHVPVVVARLGETWQVGDLSWQTLWPAGAPVVEDGADSGSSEGSDENDASVVWRARAGDISVLMTGDVEPSAQATLLRRFGGALAVDVLKVPHHGSRYQDPGFVAATGARVALVSAGSGNDYGHPNPGTVALLTADGARVLRTDVDGASAVAGDHAHLRTVTQLARPRSVVAASAAVSPGPAEPVRSVRSLPTRPADVVRWNRDQPAIRAEAPAALPLPRCRSPTCGAGPRSAPGRRLVRRCRTALSDVTA